MRILCNAAGSDDRVDGGKDVEGARGTLLKLASRWDVVACGIGVGRANFKIGLVADIILELYDRPILKFGRPTPPAETLGSRSGCGGTLTRFRYEETGRSAHLTRRPLEDVEDGKGVEDAREA